MPCIFSFMNHDCIGSLGSIPNEPIILTKVMEHELILLVLLQKKSSSDFM